MLSLNYLHYVQSHNISIGKIGEQYAVNFLIKNGFSLILKNYRTRYGELDIIVKKGGTIHFIEVKTRTSYVRGKPYEAVNMIKLKHLFYASNIFLLKNNIKPCKLSLDVISIWLNPDSSINELLFFENIYSS